MLPLKKINKTHVILSVFGLVILLLIVFFVWPLFIKIKNSSHDLTAQKNEAGILRAQSDQIENFKKVYNDYKSNLEKMEEVFIDPKNPVNFIEFLEATAQISGVNPKISLIKNQQELQERTVAFKITASDDFLKLLDFSERLENGPYLVEILSVSMRQADMELGTDANSDINVSSPGKVDTSFLINAFAKP